MLIHERHWLTTEVMCEMTRLFNVNIVVFDVRRDCEGWCRVSAIGEDGEGSAECRRDNTVFMLQTGGHFTELCVRNAPRRKSRARLTARKNLEERLKLLAEAAASG